MDFILLGLLQGITEFFPISSSGHLFLMERILQTNNISLSVVLLFHLATLFSITAIFYKEIKNSIVVCGFSKKTKRLIQNIFIALIPLLFVGLFFKNFIHQSFFNKWMVSLGFFSSGIILLFPFFIKPRQIQLEYMQTKHALLIGVAQAIATLPGFSRAGLTIVAGLYCGLSPTKAVYFSFLIACPAIAGSVLMNTLTSDDFYYLFNMNNFLSFLAAFISGYFCLAFILKVVKQKKLYWFSIYLLPLSFIAIFL